jgi:hypothetical protein
MTSDGKISFLRDSGRTDAKEIVSTVRLIGPQEAAHMLETMKYKYQRTINRTHVKALAEEMIAGRFVDATTIRIAYLGSDSHLIDGQHRLSAVVMAKKPQIFTVLEEVASDADYIAWAYGNIDTGRGRSYGDLFRPIGMQDRTGLTATQVNNLSAAVDILIGGMVRATPGNRATKADRVRIVELYAPYMQEYASLSRNAPKTVARALNRGYVIAVAMVSLRWRTKAAGFSTELFWSGVATDDRLAAKDPRKAVHKHLSNTTMRGGVAHVNGSSTTTAYGARYIANCYNAYLTGKERSQSKVPDETAPFKMIGVPSDPREWLK